MLQKMQIRQIVSRGPSESCLQRDSGDPLPELQQINVPCNFFFNNLGFIPIILSVAAVFGGFRCFLRADAVTYLKAAEARCPPDVQGEHLHQVQLLATPLVGTSNP